MTPLRPRLLAAMQLRNYSPLPMRCSLRCVAEFARHWGGSPAHLGPEQVRTSQHFLLQDTQMSWTAVVQTVCALRFCYRITLGRPEILEYIASPQRPFTRPILLRPAAVATFLSTPRNLQQRAILTTLSAAGLRVSARCPLPVTAMDSARLVLRGRHGKGPHERSGMLSPTFLPVFRPDGPQHKPRPWLFPGPPGHARYRHAWGLASAGTLGTPRTSRRPSTPPDFGTVSRRLCAKRGWSCGGATAGWALGACARPAATSMAPHRPSTRPPAPWRHGPWRSPDAPPRPRSGGRGAPVWRRLSGALGLHLLPRAAPRPPGDRGLPDRRPGRACGAV